jgi:hypothetical protein
MDDKNFAIVQYLYHWFGFLLSFLLVIGGKGHNSVMSLREGNSKPKTSVKITIIRNEFESIRRATVPRIDPPRTAAQDSSTRSRMVIIPTISIRWSFVVVIMPTIFTPFPDISIHIK